jgi:hypothetical protein
METLVILCLVFSGLLFIGGGVVVIRTLIRDRRIEDAMQRQRERQNAEMWRRINEAVSSMDDSA